MYGIKIDLRDGYHIPLANSSMKNFGVGYDGFTYVFARMPMGLSLAPAEMQHFACATVKLVESQIPGVKGVAYLDDFLSVSRQPHELFGVYECFVRAGLRINMEKSVCVLCHVLCISASTSTFVGRRPGSSLAR